MGLMTAFEAMINAYVAIDAGGPVPPVAPWRTCLTDCSTRILLIPDFDVITKANIVDRIGVNAAEVKKNEGKKGKKNRNAKSTFCSRCGRSNHDLGGCFATYCICREKLNMESKNPCHQLHDTKHDELRAKADAKAASPSGTSSSNKGKRDRSESGLFSPPPKKPKNGRRAQSGYGSGGSDASPAEATRFPNQKDIDRLINAVANADPSTEHHRAARQQIQEHLDSWNDAAPIPKKPKSASQSLVIRAIGNRPDQTDSN
jgi:hypothetical protein